MNNRIRLTGRFPLVLLFLVFASLCLTACQPEKEPHTSLEKLIIDVFAPVSGENVLVMVDLPHGKLTDHERWMERRSMAEEWRTAFSALEEELGISVYPMLTYPATGAHNSPLPTSAEMDEQTVSFEEIFDESDIVVAMTEYSATAPLFEFTEKFSDLRAASMPGVMPSMMDTALAADYSVVAERCQLLADRLDRAETARLAFSTGHELIIDLRFRQARVDDGRLHADKTGERVINLPSGEVYIAPYEGEKPGHPSRTEGTIPLSTGDGSFIAIRVEKNRVVEVVGQSPEAEQTRQGFAVDDGRRNFAELGLGCNDKAVVTGNVLEDEKVMGVHLAGGLSEHIGGTVGVDDFNNPDEAFHTDTVYPFGGDIEVISLIIEYEDGTSEAIIEEGQYTLFDDDFN